MEAITAYTYICIVATLYYGGIQLYYKTWLDPQSLGVVDGEKIGLTDEDCPEGSVCINGICVEQQRTSGLKPQVSPCGASIPAAQGIKGFGLLIKGPPAQPLIRRSRPPILSHKQDIEAIKNKFHLETVRRYG